MSVLFAALLHALHFLFSLVLKARSFWQQQSPAVIQPLLAPRRRTPKHLAIIFVARPGVSDEADKDVLTESVLNAVRWCRRVGIKKLTVYEENDLLQQCTLNIQSALPIRMPERDSSESEIDYPLTPPPSDYSESRPLSPNNHGGSLVPVTVIHVADATHKEPQRRQKSVKRRQLVLEREEKTSRNDLLLCLASRRSAKPAIASAAQALAQIQNRRTCKSARPQKDDAFVLTVDGLDHLLEDDDGLSSPDFMIIHHIDNPYGPTSPPELHGFPPWHIRLTEIYHNQPHLDNSLRKRQSPGLCPLDETSFRAALDEFASAEMRFGK